MPCVEPVTSATFPGSLMTASSSTRTARERATLFQGHEPIRTLDLYFNEGHRLLAAVHHVMGDASGTHVAVAGGEAQLCDLLAVMDAHARFCQEHGGIRPSVLMPAGDRAPARSPSG